MTKLTTSVIAAAILAVLAGAAQAQSTSSGPSRQIQVLPAPGQEQVAQAQEAAPQAAQTPAPETDGAAAQPEKAQPEAQIPAPNSAPTEARPAPKFAPVPPKFVAPKRPAYAEGYGSYGYAGHGYAPKRYRNHCH
jgi:2-oxoglutarate dehydrogenase E2 component (dihydrolipoamide succinyltransferase)